MAPQQIHLIRHAQGFHNLCIENHNIRDPLLTPEGEQQCIHLSNTFKDIQLIDCIIASPIRRALCTALITFKTTLKTNPTLQIIALPDLQETSALPCDIGLSREQLLQEFKDHPIDFTHVDLDWNNKVSGPYAPRTDLVTDRVRKARRFIQDRKESHIAVVTHGGLLHFLTDDWLGSMSGCGTGWTNCELRTFEFDTSTPFAVSEASLIETQDSILRRIDNIRPVTPDQQIELRAVTQESWARDGYIILPDGVVALEERGEDGYDGGNGEVPVVVVTSSVEKEIIARVESGEGSDEVVSTNIKSLL